jgi:hypothetical protein
METVDTASGQTHHIVVSPVSKQELKLLTRAKYSFDWRVAAKTYALFKLTIEDQDEILGVMALVDYPEDSRLEIKLLASSRKNVGIDKKFNGIVDGLLAYACGESVKKYETLACVSLVPKTALKRHYIKRYGMLDGGRQLFLEGKPLFDWARKNI